MLNQNLYTACITPFNTYNEIDYTSLKNLVTIQAKVNNGLLILGSTGESYSLSENEKKNIINFICDLNLKTEIIVGVPNYNLETTLKWIKYCNNLPITGYLVAPPVYTKPGIKGQTLWFEQILKNSKYPIMAYNIPGRVGVELYPQVINNISTHNMFVAIKNATDNIESIINYKITAPNIQIYSGEDHLMPSMAIEGAKGLISVASNAWPKEIKEYVNLSLKHQEFKNKFWWKACKSLFTASNPIPIKALLKDINIINHDNVRIPLSVDDLNIESRKNILSYHNSIQNKEY